MVRNAVPFVPRTVLSSSVCILNTKRNKPFLAHCSSRLPSDFTRVFAAQGSRTDVLSVVAEEDVRSGLTLSSGRGSAFRYKEQN